MSSALNALLNAYWLRPETALWRACDVRAMSSFTVNTPSLDLGCGDGVFSFIRAGGRFSPEFDVFQVSRLERYFDNVDIYDTAPTKPPAIERGPLYRFTVGLDHKANLLSKARTLGLYEDTVEWDANQPLPFRDGSFASVFSNVVYWLDDPEHALREIRRVLKAEGRVCLMLPDKTLGEYRLGIPELDRGRTDNIKHMRYDWQRLVEACGLSVVSHVCFLSRHIVQFWDIGLRPFFPALKAMAGSLRDRRSVKSHWVSTCEAFMTPMLERDTTGAFHCFTLAPTHAGRPSA